MTSHIHSRNLVPVNTNIYDYMNVDVRAFTCTQGVYSCFIKRLLRDHRQQHPQSSDSLLYICGHITEDYDQVSGILTFLGMREQIVPGRFSWERGYVVYTYVRESKRIPRTGTVRTRGRAQLVRMRTYNLAWQQTRGRDAVNCETRPMWTWSGSLAGNLHAS